MVSGVFLFYAHLEVNVQSINIVMIAAETTFKNKILITRLEINLSTLSHVHRALE